MTYKEQLHSKFYGIMDWQQCYNVFTTLTQNAENWYLYNLEKEVPTAVLPADIFIKKITRIQNIIKELHQERYCGIVYADDLKTPTMVKIFHPNNLGKSCGSSETPPLPQWILSKTKPKYIQQVEGIKQGFIRKFFAKD